jgi:hypothetical protein
MKEKQLAAKRKREAQSRYRSGDPSDGSVAPLFWGCFLGLCSRF